VQSGRKIDLYDNIRVIISSLEFNRKNNLYIHRQRCRDLSQIYRQNPGSPDPVQN
jgi:hypothetical protein